MGVLSDGLSDFNFQEIIEIFIDGGWYEYLFPFLLIYALVLTVLKHVKALENNKAAQVIIALVFALFSIAFPITDGTCNNLYGFSGCTIGNFIAILFPGVTAFALALLGLYIIVAMTGLDILDFLGDKDSKIIKYVIGSLGILVVGFYFAKGYGWDADIENLLLYQLITDPLLWILLVFLGLLFYISNDEGGSNSSSNS